MDPEIDVRMRRSLERGNGARELLQQYFCDDADAADHLLAWLWTEGFMVVPIGERDGETDDQSEESAAEQ